MTEHGGGNEGAVTSEVALRARAAMAASARARDASLDQITRAARQIEVLRRQRARARVLRRRTGRRRTAGHPSAKDTLFAEHAGLATAIARRYAGRGEVQADLEQVAYLALHQAVRRFDPDRGIPFSHFAERTISGEVKRHFRDTRWAMRVPRSVQEAYLAVRDAMDHLSTDLGRSPTPQELADATGRPLEEVVEALDAGSVFSLASLDAPSPMSDGGDGRDVGGLDLAYDRADARLLLGPLLADLPERDLFVLRLRFDEGLSQSQIASMIGVSQMQVSRILRRVLAQLRVEADDEAAAATADQPA